MEPSYFDKIPLWNEADKRFEITADAISGRIPVTKIERWQDFSTLLESDFFNQNGTQLVFRGHRRYDWSLLPTLGRLTENGIISDSLANQQLELFRRAVRGRLKDSILVEDEQEEELWSVGQHHGLMTPLLDWTYSPYVALFFAFAKEDQKGEEDNPYRSIYVLNKSFVTSDCTDIRFFEPRRDDHGRLVNQAGLFTFSPSDATIENKLIEIISEFDEFKETDEENEAEFLAKYICKIYIRNEDRQGCLRSLRRMNVHHASLFPDLIGASDYCNILMEEEQQLKAITEAITFVEQYDQVTVSDEISVETVYLGKPVIESDTKDLVELLKSTEGGVQVEPGRIQLIANQLAKELKRNQVVDWDMRDAAQAKLRNIARTTLRKYGFPLTSREVVVEKILDVAARELTDKDT
jgi:hypothetical protein